MSLRRILPADQREGNQSLWWWWLILNTFKATGRYGEGVLELPPPQMWDWILRDIRVQGWFPTPPQSPPLTFTDEG